MPPIPGSAFVIGEDGGFDLRRDVPVLNGFGEQQRFKRSRAPSLSSSTSSCTVRWSSPDPEDGDFLIIDPQPTAQSMNSSKRRRREKIGGAPNKDQSSPSKPHSSQPRPINASAATLSRSQSDQLLESSRESKARISLPHRSSAPRLDGDGFEEIKYGPDGRLNLDDLEERFEEEFYGRAAQETPRNRPSNVASLKPPRLSNISLPWITTPTYQLRNMTLRSGKTVELSDGTFLKIDSVIQNLQSNEVRLRGWLMKKCSALNGLLPKKLNELCFTLEVESDDPRSIMEQNIIEKGLQGVHKLRHLICTNLPVPQLSFPRTNLPFPTKQENVEYVRNFERLVVRWKLLTEYENSWERRRKTVYPINIRKISLEHLTEDECTPGCFMDPAILKAQWRGEADVSESDTKTLLACHDYVVKQEQAARRSAPSREVTKDFECEVCGKGFDEAEDLFRHHQDNHEKHSDHVSIRRRARSYSVIELMDEEDAPQRPSIAREEMKELRSRLNSLLSINGGVLTDDDQVEIVSKNGRRVHVKLSDAPVVPSRNTGQTSSRSRSCTSGPSVVSSGVTRRVDSRTYTYGDAFCGAGGTTRGAASAGLRVAWGLDLDCNAGRTWRANFPDAAHYEKWAHQFIAMANAEKRYIVDVLHLSPPCQVFSPVHTVVGQNDKQNFDSLFACDAVVFKARPRIITLEQTFGILHPKFEAAFNSLIQTFTSYGYSVSWQIVQFQKYGLAQSRRRLIIFASCPGETLPQVPAYTHSANPQDGLKPLSSVLNILNRIPRDAPNHDIESVSAKYRAPWNAHGIIPAITCDGGVRGHPIECRPFTPREIASLQSFPHYFHFYGNAIKKQIGNAVPPLIAKMLFKAIVQHLEKVDAVEREKRLLASDVVDLSSA